MPSTAAVALALLVSLSPFLSEAPARGAITVDTSAGDADARASFDVNGDGTLDPSEIDVAGPVQGDDIVLDAGIESSSAHGEQHTTVSAAGSSLSISSRGVCSGRTVLTGDHEKDLRRGGGGEAGRHIEFTLTQPGTFALSGSVATAPDPVQQTGGGDNRARFDLCCLAGGQPISIESDDAFRDTGGTIPVSASGPLPPGTYSIGAQCQSLAPRLVFVGGESRFDAPGSSGAWTFSLTVSEDACGAGVACDEFRWVGGASGAFADPHSWDPSGSATEGVPTFVDGVRSDKGSFTGGQHVVLDLAASGLAAPGAPLPRGPSRRMGELVIQGTRTLEPVGGTLILDDLDPTLPERSLRIGGGTLVLDQGGVTARHVSVGFLGDGGLEVVGPSGSFTSLGSLGVGADRSGDVTIRDGASVTTAETRIGEGDGGGAATITGAASTWTTGNLAVGFSSSAALSIEDGAHVTSESAFVDCQLAQGPGVPGCTGLHGDARAEATVTGAPGGSPSSWLLAGALAIGPRGKVSVEGGAALGGVGLALPSILVGPSGSDADCVAGHACLAVEDGTVTAAAISVGAGGAGKLRIGPAGRVSSLIGVGVAAQALARGEVEVVGPSAASQLTASGLSVGTELGSHGEVRLEDGAQVSATGDSSVGTAGPGSFGLIEIAGGAAAPDATVLHVTNANLELGADAAGPEEAIFGPTGELALSNGRLELEDAALEIRRTGLVSGSGRIDELGVSVVTNDGEIDCGVAIHGAYAAGADGVLECPQASLPGGVPQLSPLAASRFARALRAHPKPQLPPSGPFVVDGDATLGGTLVLQFLNGAAPRQGDAFELLDVSGTVTGAFANVVVRGLAPGAQLVPDLAGGKLVLTSMTDATALPTVSLKARPTLKETKAKGGAKVKFSRSGDTSLPLEARYRVRGTAENGVDYEELPGVLEIPAGKRSATLLVKPFSDGVPEGTEAVEIELLPGDDYAPSLASKVALALVEPKTKKR